LSKYHKQGYLIKGFNKEGRVIYSRKTQGTMGLQSCVSWAWRKGADRVYVEKIGVTEDMVLFLPLAEIQTLIDLTDEEYPWLATKLSEQSLYQAEVQGGD